MMEYILDDSNLKVLETLAKKDTLYAFDFDGTLSSIVADYNNAKAREAVNNLMIKICNLVPVAVISGRSVADLKRLINFNPKYIIGNHGLEGILSKSEMDKIEIQCNLLKQKVLENFASGFENAGIEVEDKTYSFSLHYRNAQDQLKAERIIHKVIRSLPKESGIIIGKYVLNVLPFSEINKGYAFKKILTVENKKTSFFIGDDDTDEDIFKIIDSDCVTIRVERSFFSKAKYYINSQSEIEILLTNILNLLEQKNDLI